MGRGNPGVQARNVYTYNPADFHGYGVVAAVFADEKGLEELAFSNLTNEILNVDEISPQRTMVYPNPANVRFTVEGTGNLHITNALGQEIMVKEIDGKTTIELPQGFYFVKLNNLTQKIVVK